MTRLVVFVLIFSFGQASFALARRPLPAGCERLLGSSLDASILLADEGAMPTLTIRNVPGRVVQSLKALARRHKRSMEQEVRELLEGYVAERRALLAGC